MLHYFRMLFNLVIYFKRHIEYIFALFNSDNLNTFEIYFNIILDKMSF